jgi:streptogramin lyase
VLFLAHKFFTSAPKPPALIPGAPPYFTCTSVGGAYSHHIFWFGRESLNHLYEWRSELTAIQNRFDGEFEMSENMRSKMNNQQANSFFDNTSRTKAMRHVFSAIFLFLLVVLACPVKTGAAPTVNIFPIPLTGSLPQSITLGPDGNLWMTQFNGNSIARIFANGPATGFVTEFTIPTKDSRPYGIAAGPDGNLWFTEAKGNKIGRITTNGIFLPEFFIPTLTNSNPAGITAGPDGRMWFTEINFNAIGAVTMNGVFSQYRGIAGKGAVIATNSLLYNITAGPDGNLWFVEGSRAKIGRINPTNHQVNEFILPIPNCIPFDLVSSPGDNSIYFTEYASKKIGRLSVADSKPGTTNGITQFQLPSGVPRSTVNGPYGITIDNANGIVWFSEYNSNSIGALNISNGSVTEFRLPALTYNTAPSFLAFNPKDKSVWMTEPAGNTVYHFFQQLKPAITRQPLSQTVPPGTNVTFSVTASGASTLAYQWLFNGSNIVGATKSSFAITNVQPTDAGNYSVIVTNSQGSITSSDAVLTVSQPISLVVQFSKIDNLPGGTTALTLTGNTGSHYEVDGSTNLVDWTVLTNFTAISNYYQVIINAPTNSPGFFYRARLLP